MKAQSMIILAGFVLLSLCSYSQNNNAPRKGYYSIGRNAEKLEKPESSASNYAQTTEVPQTLQANRKATKGYYGIANNSDRYKSRGSVILAKTTDTAVLSQVTPVITKGYYSIGRNAEKLKQ